MCFAKNAAFVQGEFFTGAELAPTGVAGKTGQMIDVFTCPSDPIGGRNGSTASSALGSKRPGFNWE